MRYETFKFIVDNKKRFRYDNAATGGSDTSTDAGAATVNPNNYLAPIIGKATGLISVLVCVLLVLGIIYVYKHLNTPQ